jgi:uncharacterized membrane protein YeaQ/YmgE (transglycosylase-associated protein family)
MAFAKCKSLNFKIMSIIYWIILGLVAGAIAKAIHPGKDPQGCIVTMIIGIVGSVLGGFVARLLGLEGEPGNNSFIYNLLIATAGAVIALAIWAAVTRNRRRDV